MKIKSLLARKVKKVVDWSEFLSYLAKRGKPSKFLAISSFMAWSKNQRDVFTDTPGAFVTEGAD